MTFVLQFPWASVSFPPNPARLEARVEIPKEQR